MAVPPDSKEKPPPPKLDIGKLKRLFILARKQKVGCAVGLTVDGKAMVMLHKIKKPKAILKDLMDQCGDLKNPRFGTAEVDETQNPRLVMLTLNRSSPGLEPRLKKSIKGTGFTHIEVRSDQE